MNRPLSIFSAFFAGFGAVMLLLAQMFPTSRVDDFSAWHLSGPVGMWLFGIGAALFLLAVNPTFVAGLMGAIPIIGKYFQKAQPPAAETPPVTTAVPAPEPEAPQVVDNRPKP